MRKALVIVVALLAAPAAAAAQSILSSAGLGVPTPPLDPRARALGSVGTGLLGFNGSLVNPADPAVIAFRGITAALQPTRRTVQYDGITDGNGSTRFPLIHAIHPVGRVTGHLGFGSFVEQSWAILNLSREVFGNDTVLVEDQTNAKGGIGQVRVGLAYALTPNIAVGASVGRYTGSLERIVSRNFPEYTGDEYTPVALAGNWDYSGTLLAAGVLVDIGTLMRVGGSLTWSSRLDASGTSSASEDFSVQLPLQAVGGATVVLSPELVGSLGVRWEGWSAAADDLEGGAVNTIHVGGGLEYDGATLRGRPLALRVGGSYRQLPFPFAGATPTEVVASAGLGWNVSMGAGPVALIDFTVERGRTSAGTTLREDFWRFTVGMSLFGQ